MKILQKSVLQTDANQLRNTSCWTFAQACSLWEEESCLSAHSHSPFPTDSSNVPFPWRTWEVPEKSSGGGSPSSQKHTSQVKLEICFLKCFHHHIWCIVGTLAWLMPVLQTNSCPHRTPDMFWGLWSFQMELVKLKCSPRSNTWCPHKKKKRLPESLKCRRKKTMWP